MKKIYLFLLFLSPISLFHAQQLVTGPGGVPGAVLWMQTVPETADWNKRYLWKDYSGDLLTLKNYNNTNTGGEYIVDKVYFGHGYNFHPAIRLDNAATLSSKEVQILSDNLATSTLIGVFGEEELSGSNFARRDYILTLNSSAGKGFVVDKDKITNSTESGRDQLDYGLAEGYDLMYHAGQSPEPTLDAFKVRTLRSFTYIRTNKPVTNVWGERRQSHLSLGYSFSPGSIHNNSTYDTSKFLPNNIYGAYIPEMIIYGRMLSPLERVKAETYLALKYSFMLDRSYISSSDLLLWDISRNTTYNNRITGLYRDDQSGLYQRQGTTSYEEAPYFGHLAAGSSYDNEDFYSLSNKNKLLMIERFPANTLQNADYLIWGDNNQSVQTQSSDQYLGMKLMNRKWLVETNMGGKTPVPDQMTWTTSSTMQLTNNGYKLNLKKAANAAANATLASSVPLPGYEGHISFTLTAPMGGILVKFGTPNTPEIDQSNEYGIYISDQGAIYPIIHGVPKWDSKWLLTVKAGDRIRINKTRDYIIISRNGDATKQTGQNYSQISIEEADKNKPFYISVGLYKESTNEVTLQDFRAGGFIDTGNRMELSYVANRATEFASYTGQAYLLVDRSGSGNFKKEDTDLYLSDEVDTYRSKIVFNNVFFDPDNNGKDIFTFGYKVTNLQATLTKENPGCSVTGEALSNGKIHINIERGDPGFEYQLITPSDGLTVHSGAFFTTSYDIEDLAQGTYTLKLKELGGYNLLSTSSSAEAKAVSQKSITASTQGDLFQSVLKTPDQTYQMGMSTTSAIASAAVKHGFEISQGKIYIIENSVKSSTPVAGVQLNPGDKLQIYNNTRGKVQYQVNDVAFYSRNADATYYYMGKASAGQAGIYNLKNSGSTGWNYQNATLGTLSESSVESTLTLEAVCQQTQPINPQALKESSNLVMYYKNSTDQSVVTAQLSLIQPSTVTMAVFSLSGVMMYSQELTESKKEHTVDITGLPQGVYIVKFLTQEGEFTKKITLNY